MPPINQKNVPLQSGAAGALGLGDRLAAQAQDEEEVARQQALEADGKGILPSRITGLGPLGLGGV
jgi:hypothetical protein